MYIDCVTNNGKPYLRVAESCSVKVNGIRKNRKRTIRNIGPMARYDDGKPEFLQRLKDSFKAGKPIIAGLEDLVSTNYVPRKFTIEFSHHLVSSIKRVFVIAIFARYRATPRATPQLPFA